MEVDPDDDMSNNSNDQPDTEMTDAPSLSRPNWLQNIRHVFGMQPTIPQPDLHEPSAAPQAANPTRRDPAENVATPHNTDFKVGQRVKYFTSDGTFDAVVEIEKVHANDLPHYYTVSFPDLPARNERQTTSGRLKAFDQPDTTEPTGIGPVPPPDVPNRPATPSPPQQTHDPATAAPPGNVPGHAHARMRAPLRPPDHRPAAPPPLPTEVFRKASKKLDLASAPGPSGCSNTFIRAMLSRKDGLADSYATYLNTLRRGLVPLNLRRALIAGRGVGVPKPSSGVRPLVVGDAHLRFVGRVDTSRTKSKMKARFLRHPRVSQYGCGCAQGSEIMFRHVHDLLAMNPDMLGVTIDLKNAFNEYDRSSESIANMWDLVDTET